MKKLGKLIILLLAFNAVQAIAAETAAPAKPAAAEQHAYTAKTPKLNRAQLDVLLAKPNEIILIDLRQPDEVTKIGGFPAYLSIQSKDLENSLAFIPKDRLVVTVSNHAGRAGKGADLLAEKGFKVVGAVGIQDYEAEGGAVLKIAPKEEHKPADKAG
ncbi:MAG: rhodanese-like domain-containing protein [Methylococcales bacterium]|nr:rhodanese-like domain-containing protein [Methylococcales bacterium]MDP3837657.1 rhodanese-like domain-containing protein [Methylococcales bacterium]